MSEVFTEVTNTFFFLDILIDMTELGFVLQNCTCAWYTLIQVAGQARTSNAPLKPFPARGKRTTKFSQICK